MSWKVSAGPCARNRRRVEVEIDSGIRQVDVGDARGVGVDYVAGALLCRRGPDLAEYCAVEDQRMPRWPSWRAITIACRFDCTNRR